MCESPGQCVAPRPAPKTKKSQFLTVGCNRNSSFVSWLLAVAATNLTNGTFIPVLVVVVAVVHFNSQSALNWPSPGHTWGTVCGVCDNDLFVRGSGCEVALITHYSGSGTMRKGLVKMPPAIKSHPSAAVCVAFVVGCNGQP